MLKYRRIIQASARRIAKAANGTLDDLAAQRLEHEPEFTSEMLGRMKESMNGYRVRGVRWTAKTLTSHGADAQEKRFGADFIGVLNLDLPEYKVRKGFLAQAKRTNIWGDISRAEWKRMTDQCKTMLSLTAASFVFVYTPKKIIVLPALAVVSAQQWSNLNDFYSRNLVRFYEDHFESFVGDAAIDAADIRVLEKLRQEHLARSALLLLAKAGEDFFEAD